MEQRDLSQSTQYLFIIGENRDITYQAQSSNVANLTLGTAVLGAQAKDVFIPGNKLTTDPLIVQFLVSEDLREWLYIYKWMLKAKNNNASHLDAVFPCELITLDSQNRPSTKFTYIDVFPINLEDLQYTVQGDSIEITCTVTFQYNKFMVETKDGEVIDDTWNGDL